MSIFSLRYMSFQSLCRTCVTTPYALTGFSGVIVDLSILTIHRKETRILMASTITKYEFIKQNSEPVPIECVEDEHEESRDFQPSFWWNNRRYFLDDFTRCHNNPWLGYTEYPEHIHAFESDNYHDPLFLELMNDEELNIYLEREVKE